MLLAGDNYRCGGVHACLGPTQRLLSRGLCSGRGFAPHFNRIAFFGANRGPWGRASVPPDTPGEVNGWPRESYREIRTLGKTADPSRSPRGFLSTPPYTWSWTWGSHKITDSRDQEPSPSAGGPFQVTSRHQDLVGVAGVHLFFRHCGDFK